MTSFMWAAVIGLAEGMIAIDAARGAHDAHDRVDEMIRRQAFKGETIDVEAVDITDQKQIGYEVKA